MWYCDAVTMQNSLTSHESQQPAAPDLYWITAAAIAAIHAQPQQPDTESHINASDFTGNEESDGYNRTLSRSLILGDRHLQHGYKLPRFVWLSFFSVVVHCKSFFKIKISKYFNAILHPALWHINLLCHNLIMRFQTNKGRHKVDFGIQLQIKLITE